MSGNTVTGIDGWYRLEFGCPADGRIGFNTTGLDASRLWLSRLWLDICLTRCESKAAIHSCLIMAKHSNDRLQGTLDLLILKILNRGGPLHGYAIAQRIHLVTDDSLRIEEGSLYPALQRMSSACWLRAQWGTTDTGRKARLYTITPAGRRQLEDEERRWTLLTKAVEKALRLA